MFGVNIECLKLSRESKVCDFSQSFEPEGDVMVKLVLVRRKPNTLFFVFCSECKNMLRDNLHMPHLNQTEVNMLSKVMLLLFAVISTFHHHPALLVVLYFTFCSEAFS